MNEANGVPKGWATARVGDILSLINGFAFKPSHWKGSGLPIVRIQNLNDPEADYNYCPDAVPSKYLVVEGDLLFAWSGTPGTSFGAHIWRGQNAWLNQHIFKVNFDRKKFDPRFVRLAINQNLKEYITVAHGGAGLAHITKGKFEDSHLLIPPLAEQRRIMSKIEELFSDLDAGVAALVRVRTNLRRYRAAVLHAAVNGKLTEAWRRANRPSEPASQLLLRILDERRKKWEDDQRRKYSEAGKTPPNNWREKYPNPIPPNPSDLPVLPEGWCWATGDQLISYLRNGWSFKPHPNPPGHRLLRINAVRPMSVDLDEVRFVNRPITEVQGYFVEVGDLLFTRYNGSVDLLGVCGMVRRLSEPTLHPDKLIRVRTVLSHPLNAYIEMAANVGVSRQHMAARARTTAGQTGISGSDIREMPVPLCPLDEQVYMLSEVERRLSVVQAVGAEVEHGLKRATRLRQAILKRVFDGRLVQQDPSDESAAKLLERIKAEVASTSAVTAGKVKNTKGTARRRKVVTGEELFDAR